MYVYNYVITCIVLIMNINQVPCKTHLPNGPIFRKYLRFAFSPFQSVKFTKVSSGGVKLSVERLIAEWTYTGHLLICQKTEVSYHT